MKYDREEEITDQSSKFAFESPPFKELASLGGFNILKTPGVGDQEKSGDKPKDEKSSSIVFNELELPSKPCSIQQMKSKSMHRTEKAKKEKQDQIDDKVARFADKVLLEQEANIEASGSSRGENQSQRAFWTEQTDLQTNQTDEQKMTQRNGSLEILSKFERIGASEAQVKQDE